MSACTKGTCALPGLIQFKITEGDGTAWANVVCSDCAAEALTENSLRTATPISMGGSCIRCGRQAETEKIGVDYA